MENQLIHFGKLSLLYEDGFVRYIRTGDLEIVRKMYFALRDSNWATADIVRSDERVSVTPKGFDISYAASNLVDNKEVFRWHVKISGKENSEIEFSVEGEALAMYNRNRAGICVLHPICETKDKPVKITRPDGSVYEDKFPATIKPHQPFLDIKRMAWKVEGSVWAELEFEGDIFETEDQRNWSDTSFKTYSTPLSVPYPVMLKPGDKVSQKVKMKLSGAEQLPAPDLAEDIEVVIHENDSKPFPKIGVDFAGVSATSKEIELLRALKFDHLRIELILSVPSWKEKLKLGLEEAASAGLNIFIHLIIDKPDEWNEFESQKISSVVRLAISPLDRKASVDTLLDHMVPKARKLYPKALIGAGFRSFFTELNRNRFDYSKVDFVIYPVTPQAHATDSLTIVENLPAQQDAVVSAKLFSSEKSIHVGLVTIKQRFNPDAKPGTTADPDAGFDSRQETALIAGWMIGSIKYLSEGGANAITLFESHGLAGYFSQEKIFPVYNAFLALKKLKPVRVIGTWCNEPLIISSLMIEDESKQRHLLLANHTGTKKLVTFGSRLCTLKDHEIQIIPMR